MKNLQHIPWQRPKNHTHEEMNWEVQEKILLTNEYNFDNIQSKE